MIRISVIIPTFRRNDGFLRAALSVFEQDRLDGIELIAIDNSPEGEAIPVFQNLQRFAPIPFRWAHEPRPGVSHARNAGLLLARGELIAWLDDDEKAPPHWLKSMARVLHATHADCVFGPVRGTAPEDARGRAYFEKLYTRSGPERSGKIQETYGIGNSLHVRAHMLAEVAPFDVRANETGGEDDRLFAKAKRYGCTFAWASEGWVEEHIDANRLTIGHAVKRAFAYGQGPSATAFRQGRGAAMLWHMGVGIVQAIVFALAAAPAALISRDAMLSVLDRAARGLGKVFWMREQRFYGAAAKISPPGATAAASP